ncbi:hypothetical protein GCM10028805_03790 [Spirosoma harenae]
MKWIKLIVTIKYQFLCNLIAITVWAQPAQRVAPTTSSTAVVRGIVQDGQTKTPIAGAIVLVKNQTGAIRAQQTTNAQGAYQLILDPKLSYIFTAKAEGYASLDEQLAFTNPAVTELTRTIPTFLYRSGTKPVNQTTVTASTTPASQQARTANANAPVELPEITARGTPTPLSSTANGSRVTPPKTLDAKVMYTPPPLVVAPGKTTQLKALQFVQSKAELLPEAQPALDQLLAYMNEHPTTEIELAGHTDNQGDFDENVKLSKQRVDLVKDYLVKNGIAANRITTRGFGPTRPIANNRNENTRQLNRRVEMTVIKQ